MEGLKSELEYRLAEWAKWNVLNFAGWPPTSPMFALCSYGGQNVKEFSSKAPTISDNPAVEEMDSWISLMERELVEVVKLKYLGTYKTLDELARKSNMKLPTFKLRLERAKMFLLGRLTQKKEAKNDKRYLQAI